MALGNESSSRLRSKFPALSKWIPDGSTDDDDDDDDDNDNDDDASAGELFLLLSTSALSQVP